jgi:serine/threonine protein kinase
MIQKSGEIRLIDFGYSTVISKEIENKKQRFCGTPYYFPPEFIQKKQIQGKQLLLKSSTN